MTDALHFSRHRALAAAFLLTLASSLTGCYTTGLRFPPSVQKIAIPVFGNETQVRGLEYIMTDVIRVQLLETSEVRLVNSEADADAIIRGRIVKADFPVLVGASKERILEGSTAVAVSAELVDTRSGRILARVSGADLAEFTTDLGETRKTSTQEVMLELSRKVLLGLSQRSRDSVEEDPSTRGRSPSRK